MRSRDSWILNLSFPLAGTITTYLGTLLPLLVIRWSLTDSQAGGLFTSQFAGAMAGSLTQGWIARKWSAPRCVALGYLLMALGTAGITAGGFAAGMAAVFWAGVGIGWSVPASNWLAARYCSASDQVRAINILNSAWCAGAVAGPALVARGLAWFGLAATLFGLTAVLLGAACMTFLLGHVEPILTQEAGTPKSKLRVRNLALVAAAMLFIYVGLENGISGWTPSLAVRDLRLNAADASLALSAFWGSVLVARLVVSFTKLSHWIGLGSLIAGLTSTAAGVVCMTSAHDRILLGLGVILAGLGCSTIFPTIVSLFQIQAGPGSENWVGFVIGAGSLGAAILPWLVGAASAGFGGLRWSMLTILVAAIAAMAALLPAMRLREPADAVLNLRQPTQPR